MDDPSGFSSNYSAQNQGSISSVALFSNEGPSQDQWTVENPHPIVLVQAAEPDSALDSSVLSKITAVSPSNPAVLFSSHRISRVDKSSFSCTTISILSSARTVEIYSNGEYTGTFRGEPLPGSKPAAAATLSAPPLFLIHVPYGSGAKNVYEMVVKFFIPKKPVAFQDSLTLHWLILQGSLKTTPAPSLPSTNPSISSGPMTMAHLAQSLSSVQLGGTSPGDQKIDMSKVKELMGQDQIEGLSYSAKELLKTMDMQSSLGGLGSALPFAAMAKLASMQSSFPGPLPSPTTTSLSESASSVVLPPQPILTPPAHDTSGKDSEGGQYVTKAELAALEDRIMSNLDQKLAQMEKRILNALLSRKDSP